MNNERTYKVNAHREGRWWVFEIPELDTGGQAASLEELSFEAEGVVAMWLDVDPATVAVDITVQGLEDALDRWNAAVAAEDAAREAQSAAAAQKRAAFIMLTDGHQLSVVDAGRMVGVSKSRAYQIAKSGGTSVNGTARRTASKALRSNAAGKSSSSRIRRDA